MKQILADLRRDQLQKIADDTRNDRRRVAQIVHKMVVDALAMNSYEQSSNNSKGFPKMTKTSITATFANGETITRKTTMKLTHAWRAFGADKDGVIRSTTGFSSSADKARKAANAELRYFTHNPSGIEVVPVTILSAADEKKAKADNPFMVQLQYVDGRKYKLTGRGNKVLRYATRAEADTAADAERTRRGPRSDVQVTVIGNPPMLRRK